MNIEIHQPRLEALIQRRMASGQFESIEDALVQALEAAPPPQPPNSTFGQSLVDVCAQIKDLGEDIDFSRPPDAWRPLDLA